MSVEVAFAAGYAVVIVAAATGIDRIGRAGVRRRLISNGSPQHDAADTPWPELGSMALHTVIAAVAVVASLGLVAVVLIRHHAGVDVATLAAPALLGLAALRGLAARRPDVHQAGGP